ncbi:MAG: hypothetical protein DI548_08655 [Flavobacterium johnsoniae]|nr:MAG: hypothetical protein DI548_08655 [Flavobacterium johnsoniae]
MVTGKQSGFFGAKTNCYHNCHKNDKAKKVFCQWEFEKASSCWKISTKSGCIFDAF